MSKWIYETVESHIDPDQDPNKISTASEDIINLQAEVNRLKDELKDKTVRLERAETKLFNIDYRPFLDPDPESAKFSEELIDLLKGGGTWSGRQILKALHIDSANSDSIRIVGNQLNILQSFELIEETARGWRWVGDER